MKTSKIRGIALVLGLALASLGAPSAAFAATPTPTPSPSAASSTTASTAATPTSSATAATTASASPSASASTSASTATTSAVTPAAMAAAVATGPAATPTIKASANTGDIPQMVINLPQGYSLSYLQADKNNSIPTNPITETAHSLITIFNPDGTVNSPQASLEEIKGRGNFTWSLPKKAYNIKFDTKQTVLGMASAKSWSLLANYTDGSLLRNKTAFDAALAAGMTSAPESRYVNLVINGVDLGNYQVTEKIQVNKERVKLSNPQGILVELDNNYGSSEDFYYFASTSGSLFTLKDAVQSVPTPASKNDETLMNLDLRNAWLMIRNRINAFEAELYKPTPDWTKINSMIDVKSFAQFYFIEELAANPEITQSSIYFYMDGPNDTLHAGPVWDFDSAFGAYLGEPLGGLVDADYVKNARVERLGTTNKTMTGWFTELFRMPQFAAAANTVYSANVRPVFDAAAAKVQSDANAMMASANHNFQLWPILGGPSIFEVAARNGRPYASTYAGEVSFLKSSWVAPRVAMLDQAYGANAQVMQYQGYVAGVGWQNKQTTNSAAVMTGGQIAGTVGQSLNLQAVKLLGCYASDIQINSNTGGWSGFNTSGQIGSVGSALYAVQLKLTGALAQSYDIYYRVHVANVGWQGGRDSLHAGWVANGGTAGFPGSGNAIQAIEIKLMIKGAAALSANGTGAGGFVPLCPARILDTRTTGGAVAPGGTVNLQVTGNGGVPGSNVASVVMNVTAVGGTQNGNVTVYPSSLASAPGVSNLNYGPGQTIPNLVTVKLGTDGQVKLLNQSAGTVYLLADVVGYYVGGTPSAAGAYVGVTPTRILDTRYATGVATTTPVGVNGTVKLTVNGVAGVPASNVSAVVLNVTETQPQAAGNITAYPSNAASVPGVSNLNFLAGNTRPNLVTVKVAPDGSITLANQSSGTTHLIADIAGYYIGGTASAPGMFVAIDPVRMLDTRYGTGGFNGPVGPNSSVTVSPSLASAGSAVVMNVTVAGPQAAGNITAYPSDATTVPVASNLNFVAGDTYPNAVISKLGSDGKVKLANQSTGMSYLLADLQGYFLK